MNLIFKNSDSSSHPLTKYTTMTNYPSVLFFFVTLTLFISECCVIWLTIDSLHWLLNIVYHALRSDVVTTKPVSFYLILPYDKLSIDFYRGKYTHVKKKMIKLNCLSLPYPLYQYSPYAFKPLRHAT